LEIVTQHRKNQAIFPFEELLVTIVSISSSALVFTRSASADYCIFSLAVALPSKPGLILAKHNEQSSTLPALSLPPFTEL